MNDFTKDELQEIIDMANDIHNGSQGHGLELHFKLRDKTQSMIDDYCEHKETEIIGGWLSKCVKCGMKFGDETQ